MTSRLESILQKVLDHLESSKEKGAGSLPTIATMDKVGTSGVAVGPSPKGLKDDDILSLGISEAPVRVMRVEMSTVQDAKSLSTTMSRSGSSTTLANIDVPRPKKDDLETLLQLIRQEMTRPNTSVLDDNAIDASPTATVAPLPAVEIEDVVVDAGVQEKSTDVELPPVEPPTTEPVTSATTLTIITTDTSANEPTNNSTIGHTRTQTRPEGISTSSLELARRTSYSSTASTPTTSLASASSVSSVSSNSSYFFSSTKLGSLSTPSSPGLGGIGGPDGQTLLDVEALCRDLAFRSFPTQHQWSKKSKKLPPVWYPTSSTSSSAGASGLPPRPPSSTSQH
ncbi:MAG: hypothetical protein JOS17DRAFT_744774 [Linnemannia elongata]|nr:MAG: hypothetical protein JOS17DRAFT_744774 [Linnemannia elongata]